MNQKELEAYRKAGKIAKQTVDYAKKIIKPEMPLLEIAEKIEGKILELGAKPAFPVNLCVDDVAAHYTPSSADDAVASGLLNIDIGVHISGFIADTAFSVDLTKNNEHKKIIEASEKALENAIKKLKQDSETPLNETGKTIQETISSLGFSPIRNLSGHSLGEYFIHAGITIPNYDNGNDKYLGDGAYAIEPFATSGEGVVYDGGRSNIYRVDQIGTGIRDKTSREIYKFATEEYETLPFCERWITKKFGSRSRVALLFLEKSGVLHHYPQLVEKSHSPVSQAEHTIIIHKDKTVEVTTE